ncbi:HWE histidine kinase domain-containing protein [Geminicoccaceae bacterium 1502E]|nr:HWE histidine kinase domain-containing protein [Geminicoccaceae bacterium 1502E]
MKGEHVAGPIGIGPGGTRSLLLTSGETPMILADAIPHLVWMADAEGSIFWFNRRWYEYTGTSPEEMVGWGWQSVHDPAELPRVLEEYRAGLARGARFEMLFPLRGADGKFRRFLTRVEPFLDEHDATVRWVGTNTDVTLQVEAERALREETRRLDTLNRVAGLLTAELDLEKLVQAVTDASVALAGAQFGAFFHNVEREGGEAYTLYTLSGASRDDFAGFPMPRNTPIFGPTFRGERVVRYDDVLADPDYGTMAPYFGLPSGHLPVRSYLAAPVVARCGEVLGGIFLAHGEPGQFTAEAERLIVGVAAQAAIAIDNARLFQEAKRELAERQRAEEQQRLLLNELNHRVKNTLATVHSIATQTLQTAVHPQAFADAFVARLLALSHAHDLLNGGGWQGAWLRAVLERALAPHGGAEDGRLVLEGENVWLAPQVALAFGMAFHELVTNAAKYGALSTAQGRVTVSWRREPGEGGAQLRLLWVEEGGPPVRRPARRGFGSKLIERGLSYQLRGEASLTFAPEGVRCEVSMMLPDAP